jgi:hypothetical protein
MKIYYLLILINNNHVDNINMTKTTNKIQNRDKLSMSNKDHSNLSNRDKLYVSNKDHSNLSNRDKLNLSNEADLTKWCKENEKKLDKSTLEACTCILEGQTYGNILGCAAARVLTCQTGKVPVECQGQNNPNCPCTHLDPPQSVNPAIGDPYNKAQRAYLDWQAQCDKHKACTNMYNTIQGVPYGQTYNPGRGINTFTAFGSEQRFCGQSHPGQSPTDVPWYFIGQPPVAKCGNPYKGFACNDAETGITGDSRAAGNLNMEHIQGYPNYADWWEANGFQEVPKLNVNYEVVKWTNGATDAGGYCNNCNQTGVLDGTILHPEPAGCNEFPNFPGCTAQCAVACQVGAQVRFTKTATEMCVGDPGPPPPTFDPQKYCGEYMPQETVVNCCTNSAQIEPGTRNINIHQKCTMKDYSPSNKICAEYPQLPGCSAPPNPPGPGPGPPNPPGPPKPPSPSSDGGGTCSDTKPCKNGACIYEGSSPTGKCKCGPDRTGPRCETCKTSFFNCGSVPGAVLNETECKCECGPGYWGNPEDKICYKEDVPWYQQIINWFRNLWTNVMKDTNLNKILLLVGVCLLIISLIILSIMVPDMF